MTEEVLFPRGKPPANSEAKKKPTNDRNDTGWKSKQHAASKNKLANNRKSSIKFTSANGTRATGSKLSRTTNDKKRKSSKRSSSSSGGAANAGFEPLKLTNITTGMLFLGRVKDVRSGDARIGLPNNIEARVGSADISGPFSRRLEAPADSSDISDFSSINLQKMFYEGQLVRCKVLDVPLGGGAGDTPAGGDHQTLSVTISPSEVNTGISAQKLHEGMLISGAVQSIEDHGYVIDLGIDGLVGFLNFSECADELKQHFSAGDDDSHAEHLQTGQVLLLCVSNIPKIPQAQQQQDGAAAKTSNKPTSLPSVVQLSGNIFVEKAKIKNASTKTTTTTKSSAASALPGEVISCTIKAVVSDRGIIINTNNKLTGSIPKWHLPKTFGSSKKSPESKTPNYSVNDSIDVCVLYTDPINNMLHCSALPSLTNAEHFYSNPFGDATDNNSKSSMHHYFITQIIPDCTVCQISPGKNDSGGGSIFLRTPRSGRARGVYAYCSRKYTSKIPDATQWLTKYAVGSVHTVAVTGYNWLDQMLIVSMRRDDVEQPLFAYEQLVPGQRVSGVISGITASAGIVVRLGGRLRGLIPADQLADVPLQPKNWAEKFCIGDRLPCKVLQVDAEQKRLKLTAKKSLLDNAHQMYSTYDQIRPNELCTGYVVQIRAGAGLLMKFLQDVVGFIPKSEICSDRKKSVNLNDLYYVGQVLNCRVKSCSAERRGLILTPKIGTVTVVNNSTAEKSGGGAKKNYKIGEILSCKIIGRNGASSLQVKILPDDADVCIDIEHLRDDYAAMVSSKPTARLALLGHYSTNEATTAADSNNESNTVEAVVIRTHPELKLTLKKSYVKMARQESDDTNATTTVLVKKFDDLYEGMQTYAYAAMIKEFGIFAEFTNGVRGLLPKKFFRDDALEMLKLKPENLYVGATLPVKVVDVDKEKQRCLLRLWNPSSSGSEEAEKNKPAAGIIESRKRSITAEPVALDPALQAKRLRPNDENSSEKNIDEKVASLIEVDEHGVQRLAMPDFQWNDPYEVLFNSKTIKNFQVDDDDDNEGDNVAEQNLEVDLVTERRKINAAGKNAEEFEKLVAEQPDKAAAWLQYMSFCVTNTNVDGDDAAAGLERAREVGERALRTIAFREDTEKRRIWFALLDLDVKYGKRAELDARIERAVQAQDALTIYLHVARKLEEQAGLGTNDGGEKKSTTTAANAAALLQRADELYTKMLKKFKHNNKDVCIAYGRFLYATKSFDAARKLMQRCLMGGGGGAGGVGAAPDAAALDKRVHVEVVGKFAYFEFAYAGSDGGRERAKTMMENVLEAYPKRIDVMNVYVDMLLKFKEPVEYVRKLFEKWTSTTTTTTEGESSNSNISVVGAKKIKSIFKRYVDFELAHGTPAQVEVVKERARQFVEVNLAATAAAAADGFK